jgi:hypothetical protein
MTKPLSIRRAFFGRRFRGHIPDRFGLRGADAYKQIAVMIGTMDYSTFDFSMEVSANAVTFFLNFPFWKASGAERLGADADKLDRCLDLVRKCWSLAPRSADLVEEASVTG